MTPGARIDVGHRAPDFELPAADRDGMVSLARYRGEFSVLLALFRGLYCPFCRRQMAQLSAAADQLRAVGIETIGVVATAPDRARLYFRHIPPRFPLGADPHLVTHRAYGLRVIERNGSVRPKRHGRSTSRPTDARQPDCGASKEATMNVIPPELERQVLHPVMRAGLDPRNGRQGRRRAEGPVHGAAGHRMVRGGCGGSGPLRVAEPRCLRPAGPGCRRL